MFSTWYSLPLAAQTILYLVLCPDNVSLPPYASFILYVLYAFVSQVELLSLNVEQAEKIVFLLNLISCWHDPKYS